MRHVQPTFAAGELAPSLAARSDIAKYYSGLSTMRNFLVHPHGGASNRPGTKYIMKALGAARLLPFQFSTEQNYVLVFTALKMQIVTDDGVVLYPAGHAHEYEPAEIVSPYAAADLFSIRYTQSANTMYLTCPGYAPYDLTRGVDHHLWTFAAHTFAPSVSAPAGLAAAAGGAAFAGQTFSIKYAVSVIKGGEESLPCAAVTFTDALLPWTSGAWVALSWTAVSGAELYRVYKNRNGYWGFIGEAESNSFTDDNISADISDGPQKYSNPFPTADDYPQAVGLFQQRLFFGGSVNDPQTVKASQTGQLNNFAVSSPAKDSDAIDVTLAHRQVNVVQHLIPAKQLNVMTSGGEWLLSSGDNSDALTPTSVKFEEQGSRGSGELAPLLVGDSILFAQRMGSTVRSLAYSLEIDKLVGKNISILASHLFRNRAIVDWAYQQEPDSVVWAVRDDGVLLGFTYEPDHEVWAWHRHDTGYLTEAGAQNGEFISVCTLYDDVYFLVKRTIDGAAGYYVEKLMNRLPSDDVSDAFFVDCGLTYTGAAAAAISGLGHLEGETVAALANGSVVANLVVTNGEITLPTARTKVHVGLPITAELESLNLAFPDNSGRVHGVRKVTHNVAVEFENSRELFIGPNSYKLQEIKFRSTEPYGSAIEMFSGKKVTAIQPDWNREGRIFMRVVSPVPVTILSISREVSIGDV